MLRGIWLRCWCTIWEFGVCDDYENIDQLLAKNEIDEELAQNLGEVKRYEKRRRSQIWDG